MPSIALIGDLRRRSLPMVSGSGPYPAICAPVVAAAASAKKDVPASPARNAASHVRMSPNRART